MNHTVPAQIPTRRIQDRALFPLLATEAERQALAAAQLETITGGRPAPIPEECRRELRAYFARKTEERNGQGL